MVLRNAFCTDSYVRNGVIIIIMYFLSLQNALINCFNVPRLHLFILLTNILFIIRFVLIVRHCKYRLMILQDKAEYLHQTTLVAAMFRKRETTWYNKVMHCAFYMPNLPHKITVMTINAGCVLRVI